MNEGAANLVDHVLPEQIPIRQWVLTLPYPLRYPLAFDPNHSPPDSAEEEIEIGGEGEGGR